MHAISSYRGNRPTHPQTNTHKQTGPITIHCAAASAQCNEMGKRNTGRERKRMADGIARGKTSENP